MTVMAHWDEVYSTRAPDRVSWFEAVPETSLALIDQIEPRPASVIDVGAGASLLADHLLDRGVADITVLDVSANALARVAERLGDRVERVVADVTTWTPSRRYELWHDRAAFHFLTDPAQREAYVRRLRAALAPRGHVVICTFAADGPERCSGLPVQRYRPGDLLETLGADEFVIVDTRPVEHRTPGGAVQRFQCSLLRRLG